MLIRSVSSTRAPPRDAAPTMGTSLDSILSMRAMASLDQQLQLHADDPSLSDLQWPAPYQQAHEALSQPQATSTPNLDDDSCPPGPSAVPPPPPPPPAAVPVQVSVPPPNEAPLHPQEAPTPSKMMTASPRRKRFAAGAGVSSVHFSCPDLNSLSSDGEDSGATHGPAGPTPGCSHTVGLSTGLISHCTSEYFSTSALHQHMKCLSCQDMTQAQQLQCVSCSPRTPCQASPRTPRHYHSSPGFEEDASRPAGLSVPREGISSYPGLDCCMVSQPALGCSPFSNAKSPCATPTETREYSQRNGQFKGLTHEDRSSCLESCGAAIPPATTSSTPFSSPISTNSSIGPAACSVAKTEQGTCATGASAPTTNLNTLAITSNAPAHTSHIRDLENLPASIPMDNDMALPVNSLSYVESIAASEPMPPSQPSETPPSASSSSRILMDNDMALTVNSLSYVESIAASEPMPPSQPSRTPPSASSSSRILMDNDMALPVNSLPYVESEAVTEPWSTSQPPSEAAAVPWSTSQPPLAAPSVNSSSCSSPTNTDTSMGTNTDSSTVSPSTATATSTATAFCTVPTLGGKTAGVGVLPQLQDHTCIEASALLEQPSPWTHSGKVTSQPPLGFSEKGAPPAPWNHSGDEANASLFSWLGRPTVIHVPRSRVWDMAPLVLSLPKLRTPSPVDVSDDEEKAILDGGFWERSPSIRDVKDEMEGLSQFGRARLLQEQLEAEKALAMLMPDKEFSDELAEWVERPGWF